MPRTKKGYAWTVFIVAVLIAGGVVIWTQNREKTLDELVVDFEKDLAAFRVDIEEWNELYLASDDAVDGIEIGGEQLQEELTDFSATLEEYAQELKNIEAVQEENDAL